MNQFFNAAIKTPDTVTTNGMPAHTTTQNPILDLFYVGGGSRGKDISDFVRDAFAHDIDLAGRVLLWIRDCRGGAGERQTFRDAYHWLCENKPGIASELTPSIPVVGRWDDLLAANKTDVFFRIVAPLIQEALNDGHGLAAKWMPRKGEIAVKLRHAMRLTPKEYRKLLVSLSDTVEQKMCAGKWDEIDFGHVPSVAAARLQKAFGRKCPHYTEYKEKLVKGEAKIHASSIFPHDVLKGSDRDVVQAQWDAMPLPEGLASCIPLVDVSGSMWMTGKDLQPGDVALALGLFIASKVDGPMRNLAMTFESTPRFVNLYKGHVLDNMALLKRAPWGGSTNISAALQLIVETAVEAQVPQDQMPKTLLIFSDMQFDHCTHASSRAIDHAKVLFAQAGYECPTVVFWNLNGASNMPVQKHESGAMLVSGYSPAIMTYIMAMDIDSITPEGLMMKAIMNPRYDWRW